MKVFARIPVQDVERAIREPGFIKFLIEKAETSLQDLAGERGRKLSSTPEYVDVEESRLTDKIVYLIFEAETMPK